MSSGHTGPVVVGFLLYTAEPFFFYNITVTPYWFVNLALPETHALPIGRVPETPLSLIFCRFALQLDVSRFPAEQDRRGSC